MTIPSEPETPDLRAQIEAALPSEEYATLHPGDLNGGYENAANYAVKVLMRAARRDPVRFKAALDVFRTNPYSDDLLTLLTPEEREYLMYGEYGLTGFQWGWAVQTAAFFLEQAPVPNPALLTIERES